MSRLSELINQRQQERLNKLYEAQFTNGAKIEYHASCGTFHAIKTASWTDIGLAIGGMMMLDMPLCHKILMPITSLASSAILYGFTSTAKQLGYVQNFIKIEANNIPLSDKIHDHFHQAVHHVESGLYQIYHLASSKLLGHEVNITSHSNHHEHDHAEHHGHHEHNHLMHIITEPISEISIGWLISKASGETMSKIAHSVDVLHYLLPSWAAIESSTPAIANGHAMAELFWLTSSLLGPLYDVCVTGLDPAELVGYYADNLKESGALVIEAVSLPFKWTATHQEPVIGEVTFENEVYTNSTILTETEYCFAKEIYEIYPEICFLNGK